MMIHRGLLVICLLLTCTVACSDPDTPSQQGDGQKSAEKLMTKEGTLTFHPSNVKSFEAWHGHQFKVAGHPVLPTERVSFEQLKQQVGKRVRVKGEPFAGTPFDRSNPPDGAPAPAFDGDEDPVIMRGWGLKVLELTVLGPGVAEDSFELRCWPRLVQRHEVGGTLSDREGKTTLDGDRYWTELRLFDGKQQEYVYETMFSSPSEIKAGRPYTFVIRSSDRLILQVRDERDQVVFAFPPADDEAGRLIASQLATFREVRQAKPVDVPLAKVSVMGGRGGEDSFAAPVIEAQQEFADRPVRVKGVLQDPGVPAGLGSHAKVNLHQPEDPRKVFLIPLIGNVPSARSKTCQVIGYLVKRDKRYALEVLSWELLK